MNVPSSNIGGARIAIFKELFASVSERDATILVGILFEHRFVIEASIFNPETCSGRIEQIELQPLEPDEAAARVAEAFALDRRSLYRRFVNHWHELRRTQSVDIVRGRILGHESIARLPRCSPSE